MNRPTRPTFEELSLYYDGLLRGEEKARVEAYLAQAGNEEPLLDLFEAIECAPAADLSDAEVDRLLAGNLQEIHARIYQKEQKREFDWGFFFSPKFIFGAVAALMLAAASLSTLEQNGTAPSGSNIAVVPTESPDETGSVPDTGGDFAAEAPERDVQVNEVQKQVLLAMTRYAKSAVDSGVETVTERTRKMSDSLSNLEERQTPLALDAVRTALSPATVSDATQAQNSPAGELARFGRQQVALGLGASMISMISVF